MGQEDGVGGADGAGVVSSVGPCHQPQDQGVALTGLLKRDSEKIYLLFRKSSSVRRFPWSFEFLAVSAPWLGDYSMDLLHMWHQYTP